jgi:stage V sporulation protein D (sporulation-specific penicillin-binding protein)
MEIRKILNRRLKIILIIVALIFSFLVIRITKLMFFNRELVPSSPGPTEFSERGLILDRNDEKLAISLETYSIYVRPKEVENKKEAARSISIAIDKDYSSILRLMNRKKPFVWIERQVDIRYTKRLESLDIPGVYLEKEYRRHYPYGSLASHIIGFSGIDNVGLEGIEYQFDDILLPKKVESRGADHTGALRGYTVVLTIDRYIQEVVEKELERALKNSQAKSITGIVMNPHTGDILALANKPDYDLNNFQQYSNDRKRNKAITDSFEPGSTFKVFIASILLETELVHENDRFTCAGSIVVEGTRINDIGKHGNINFRQVLERSCNVGMVEAVKRIDNNTLYERLRAFGFGEPTGINLPGEARGILRNPREWSRISKYAIAIGQEVSATPLQIAQAASALANRGDLMQPRIVKRIDRPDGSTVKEYSPLKRRTVVRPNNRGRTIAGKTGTAQIADTEKGGYLEDQFYASFLGFVPVPNPEIVVLVTIDRPVGEVYGGQTAAPVFRNIVERIANYLTILPSFSEIYLLRDG